MPGEPLWISGVGLCPEARLRLICFPAAGASPAMYRSWARALSPDFEVCPVVLPGRDRRLREAPKRSMTELIDEIAVHLPSLADRSLAVFGHSLGAWIGYELVRRLEEEGRVAIEHLIVAACAAPQVGDRRAPLHSLPEAEFIAAVREFGGTPPAVFESVELLSLALPVLRADFELYETYVYRERGPLECGISAWGGVEDTSVSPPALEAWREQSSQTFDLELFPGGHFFLEPNEHLVLERLQSLLGEVGR